MLRFSKNNANYNTFSKTYLKKKTIFTTNISSRKAYIDFPKKLNMMNKKMNNLQAIKQNILCKNENSKKL